jgi:hypothetical protein
MMLAMFALISLNGFSIEPDTMIYNWNRSDVNEVNTNTIFLANNTYLLTNNVVVGEDLSGCAVKIRTGVVGNSREFTAGVYDTSNFWCYITFPSPKLGVLGYAQENIQLTITNATVSVTYGNVKVVNIQNKLE